VDGGGQRGSGVADVGPESDVGANLVHGSILAGTGGRRRTGPGAPVGG
jgi:hypothetical protein